MRTLLLHSLIALASALVFAQGARAQQRVGFNGIYLGMTFRAAETVAARAPWRHDESASFPQSYIADSLRLRDDGNLLGCGGAGAACQSIRDVTLSTYDWGDTNRVLRIDIDGPSFARLASEQTVAWINTAREYLTRRYGAPQLVRTPQEWAEFDSGGYHKVATRELEMTPLYEWHIAGNLITLFGVTGDSELRGAIRFEKIEKRVHGKG
jgi:hypothetical protein